MYVTDACAHMEESLMPNSSKEHQFPMEVTTGRKMF